MAAVISPEPADVVAVRPVDEVAGMVRLAGSLVETLSLPVQDTHRAVAGRVFRALGPVATPVRIAHDTVSNAVYGSIRGGALISGGVAGAAVGLTSRGRDRRLVSSHPLGDQTLTFVSGLLGDWLDGRADDLVVRPGLSQHGRRISGVGDIDEPTGRVVLLVHGLAETTAAWSWWSTDDDGQPAPTYSEALSVVGWTPLEVIYDTGRPVSESGARLAADIQALVDTWPVPVKEIALIGHSMGGLVTTAACHQALDDLASVPVDPTPSDPLPDDSVPGNSVPRQSWVRLVSHMVTLGTPHAGSWLARLAHSGAEAADQIAVTKGVARILELRSPGIRDLTRGWRQPETTLPERMPDTRHAFVSASLSRPWADFVGDGLVHPRSATAPARTGTGSSRSRAGRSTAPNTETGNVVTKLHPGVGHIRLVHHPLVTADLLSWMTTPRPQP